MNSKLVIGAGLALPSIIGGVIEPDAFITGAVLTLACIGGAYASFTWGDPVEPRSKMFRLFVSCVIMGIAFSLTATWLIQWQFETLSLTNGARAGIGCIVSCLTRFTMPKVVESIRDGSWKSIIPFVGRRQ